LKLGVIPSRYSGHPGKILIDIRGLFVIQTFLITKPYSTLRSKRVEITGREKSPLGRICDHNLSVYSKETAIWLAPMSTRIAQLVLLDALFVSVANKKLNGIRDNLGKVKQSLIEKRY